MAKEKGKEVKTLCDECEKDVTLTLDEEGDYTGRCDNCGLDMGRILTKKRYDDAYEKRKARKTPEQLKAEEDAKKKKKTEW